MSKRVNNKKGNRTRRRDKAVKTKVRAKSKLIGGGGMTAEQMVCRYIGKRFDRNAPNLMSDILASAGLHFLWPK